MLLREMNAKKNQNEKTHRDDNCKYVNTSIGFVNVIIKKFTAHELRCENLKNIDL